jgi:plastocyanin
VLSRAATTLGILIVLVGAACGSDDGDGDGRTTAGGGDARNPPFEARVEITKDGYRPRHVRILVGGSVTFVNVDRESFHTAETGDLPNRATDSNEFDTHSLTWEEPYTVTFHKPERTEYHDSFDETMTGTVEAVPKAP